MISIITLILVFILTAIRQVGNLKLQIWQIMFFGALVVLITKEISFIDAYKEINFEVLLFLFSMFVIGCGIERSRYLSHLTYKIFKKTKNFNQLILLILFLIGLSSAILMNDTVAIIATPVVLLLSKNTI